MTERRKPTYTRKLHTHRVELMLNKPGELCGRCPASRGFAYTKPLYNRDRDILNHRQVCRVCMEFVCIGVPGYEDSLPTNCPCNQFGGELAIKRTLAALRKERHHDR
jgi:hypothetical protein